ncbi:hypothetical protein GGR51DRAFT_555738 [Nemania sp. FL0031]|nr:hypothetical protein GGR51DRAFT_555738 [Nemania sp. FL0031]
MQSLIVSIVAFLAATSVAVPINEPRQLPGLSPVTSVLSQVGKQVPPAITRAGDSLSPKKKNDEQPAKNDVQPAKNATQPATQPGKAPPTAQKSKSPLDSLGSLGGLGAVAGLIGGTQPVFHFFKELTHITPPQQTR